MVDKRDRVLDTLPKHFLARVKEYGDSKVAVRQKDLGIWQEYTWQTAYENVHDISLGLISIGLKHGDRVSIVGDNDRHYLWADIAIMSVGAIAVGIFTDATPAEMEYIITHSGAVIVLAKDQEQCDKLLEIKQKIPNVKKVIYWDDRGMWYYNDPWLMSLEELQQLGRDLHTEQPNLFDDTVASGSGDDYANFCYTSGTTGLPKGAMLSHHNFISAGRSFEHIDPREDTDNLLSFAPLAWIAEHTLSVTPHVMFGVIVNFPEEPETVQQNIYEIAPEVLFYPARLWENLIAMIQVRISDTSWLSRNLYDAFLPIGYQVADKHYNHEPLGLRLNFLYKLGDLLVFRPLRGKLGLVNIRTAITAGAALGPDIFRYFRAIGINLKQVFSSTETTAVGTMHRDDNVKFASVGTPLTDIQVKITAEGEICLGGDNIFMGYYKNEEATDTSLEVDEDGVRWFHSGDAGYIDDDGHLIYLDRMKDMIELANKDKFSPQFIEGRFKFSPYIRDVMAVGSTDKQFVTALISIDFENVGRWAEKNRIPFTTYVDLSQKPEVYELILEDVRRVNGTLPPGGRVRKFVLMHKEFDADEAEMTRTRKLRRGFLAERYDDIISSIYDGEEKVSIQAEVQYQDGRKGIIETEVRIMTLEEVVES
jgi:long-chain acyl-CoA synthetase